MTPPDPVQHRIIATHWWKPPPPNDERGPNGTALATMPASRSIAFYITTAPAATAEAA